MPSLFGNITPATNRQNEIASGSIHQSIENVPVEVIENHNNHNNNNVSIVNDQAIALVPPIIVANNNYNYDTDITMVCSNSASEFEEDYEQNTTNLLEPYDCTSSTSFSAG